MKVRVVVCSAGIVDTVGVLDGQMIRLVGVTWHQFDEARTRPELRNPCLVFFLGVANMGLPKPPEVRGVGGRDMSRVSFGQCPKHPGTGLQVKLHIVD